MAENLAGLKIRSLRKQAGLTQGELARRGGISPSYLNLIERNKRPVSGVLLDRLAAGLGVERALLDGEAERHIVDSLNEISADPALAAGSGRPGSAEDLVGRHPGWAHLLLRLYQAYLDKSQTVLALADRLNRDPFLSESVHRMLTNVTSIRSAAEILEMGDALTPSERARFPRDRCIRQCASVGDGAVARQILRQRAYARALSDLDGACRCVHL